MKRHRSWPSGRLVVAIATIATGAVGAFGPASTATAAVTKNGWGFFVADDTTSFYAPASSVQRQAVSRLRPKLFRFQTIWNTMDRPEAKQRVRDMIAAAKARGAEQIILTIRSNNTTNVDPSVGGEPNVHDEDDYFPWEEYTAQVTALVQEFKDDVDYWGPANEPNGDWRPSDAPGGADKLPEHYLAHYYSSLRQAVLTHDATAKLMSPDFIDKPGFEQYINNYIWLVPVGQGEGWGDIAAWHPYHGVAASPGAGALSSTNAFAYLVPANRSIWVTEVGAHKHDLHHNNDLNQQNAKVNWIVNTLGAHPRISRIAYYQMPSHAPKPGQVRPDWDTGLLDLDLSPRPAWQTWCAATHGGSGSHSDCTGYPPTDTIGVRNDAGGNCLINSNAAHPSCDVYFVYGPGSDNQAIAGDWNGDGIDTVGVYNAAAGAACLSNGHGSPCATYLQFGGPGDQAIVGDWNGDGTDTVGLHNNAGGNCLINTNASNVSCDVYFTFGGGSGNQAIAGDWNADGIDTVGVHSDAGGNCLINLNAVNVSCDVFFAFGGPGDQAIVGDWNADGTDTLGVHNDAGGNCLINSNAAHPSCDVYFAFGGGSQNQAIAGNWGP